MGYGPWSSTTEVLFKGGEWANEPWEAVSVEQIKLEAPEVAELVTGKSEKVYPGDPVVGAETFCGSSTELEQIASSTIDLVIPTLRFGGSWLILGFQISSKFGLGWKSEKKQMNSSH